MINYSIAILSSKPGTKKADIKETKAYGMAQSSGNVDINGFARHIANHGCVYSRGDIVGLLTQAVDCLKELLLEGKRVKLGDLGDFQARLKSKGAKTTDDFNARVPRPPTTSTPATSRLSTSAGSPASSSGTSAARPPSSSCPAERHRPTPSKSSATKTPSKDLNSHDTRTEKLQPAEHPAGCRYRMERTESGADGQALRAVRADRVGPPSRLLHPPHLCPQVQRRLHL